MARANIGTVERLRQMRIRPKYGRWIVSETGKVTRVTYTREITKGCKNLVIMMKVGEALGS